MNRVKIYQAMFGCSARTARRWLTTGKMCRIKPPQLPEQGYPDDDRRVGRWIERVKRNPDYHKLDDVDKLIWEYEQISAEIVILQSEVTKGIVEPEILLERVLERISLLGLPLSSFE